MKAEVLERSGQFDGNCGKMVVTLGGDVSTVFVGNEAEVDRVFVSWVEDLVAIEAEASRLSNTPPKMCSIFAGSQPILSMMYRSVMR